MNDYPLPRNVQSLEGLPKGSTIVVSFVGSTGYPNRHVFVDSGKKYDWSFTEHLHCVIAVKPGIDAKHAMRSICAQSSWDAGYPTLVDVEQQQLACIVFANPLRLWPVKSGSDAWRQHFA